MVEAHIYVILKEKNTRLSEGCSDITIVSLQILQRELDGTKYSTSLTKN